MISVEQITVEFSGRRLLDGITFLVNSKDKIGLVGRNGSGKSTLLKLIAKADKATSGKITAQDDVSVGYLPQHMIHNEGTTVMEETEKAFDKINLLQDVIDNLTKQMSDRTDYESDEYSDIINKLSHSYEQMQIMDSGNFLAEIEKTLIGLGFLRSDFNRQCSEFSGGWRMRIELAKILLQNPDVILLDEPTNHLDIESIQWLENFLKHTSSAILLVSHDKIFIDSITNRTIEISLGNIYDYKVNYSKYLELRQERHEQQVRAYENQQKIIEENKTFINRFRATASKATLVQSRVKLLEKMEIVKIDVEDTSSLRLKFSPAPRSSALNLEIENLSKSYGDLLVLDKVGMVVNRGEKIAFVGKNGEGKSTLIKCILNEIEYKGKLEIGTNVEIGYFAQNQPSLLDENLTVFQTVDNVAKGDVRLRLREILGSFMFGGDAINKLVKVLSGGERSRLAMVRLLIEPVNLLILDEPTNHLDIPSKEVLKEAIKAFNGTAIIVSHDREFLDGLVDKVYEFGNKNVREHIGGIYEFLEKKKLENLNEVGA
ncbi:MAG TPA: ABC-F family ATP-binding cassette domain-containing protein [Bacteroidales bacterium]|nr:ABC-F family ATP-binding cassette domain-containing protein [Bacteroidales bacterium]